jgi:hypothetical protein
MSAGLSVLYVGDLARGQTCCMRRDTMAELGASVRSLDVGPIERRGGRVARSLRRRTGLGRAVARLNRELARLAADVRPRIVWIDKGLLVRPATLRAIGRTGALRVHYNPDDPFGEYRSGWRTFVRAIPEYDVHFVCRDPNVDEYRARGARRVVRYFKSFYPALHRPLALDAQERRRLGGAVGFVGAWERERADAIRALAAAGIEVTVYGPTWRREVGVPGLHVRPTAPFGEDYVRVLNAFDIVLCFVRRGNRDLSTSRSFEIPGCGRFMLAERTPEHEALYREGEEAEFFGSTGELVAKVRRYLGRPDEVARIAAAGRARALAGYTTHDRLRGLLDTALAAAESTGTTMLR